jgi:excisionase family DNA binding protein
MPQPKFPRRGLSLAPDHDAVLLTLDQACARTQLSRPTVVGLIRSGRLRGVKVGTTWRISTASIEKLTDDVPDAP